MVLVTFWCVGTVCFISGKAGSYAKKERLLSCFLWNTSACSPKGCLGVQYRANREKSIERKILHHDLRLTDSSVVFIWAELSWGWVHWMLLPWCYLRQRSLLNGLENILKKQLIWTSVWCQSIRGPERGRRKASK